MRDVGGGLVQVQRIDPAAQRNTLFQLPERTLVEPIGQFGLSNEHDWQELVGIGLDVRKQPHLFHQLVRQALGLVDDEGDECIRTPERHQHSTNSRRSSVGLARYTVRTLRARLGPPLTPLDMTRRSSVVFPVPASPVTTMRPALELMP